MKIPQKKTFGGGGGVRGGESGVGLGGQGGCDRRIEVFGKIHTTKNRRGGGVGLGGVRVDVNERIEVFVKIQKKNLGGGRVRGGGGGRVGGGGSGWM